jgi:glutathione S-transferase
MKLIIGNKTYSSWSLRPWLIMKHFDLPFEEILVKLDLPDTTANIKKYSPTGKVPALIDGDLVVYESMAILEYLNEKYPEKKMYPEDLKDRAKARSLCMEMHAGFSRLRENLSFNTKTSYTNFDVGVAADDVLRINEIFSSAKGPFLFGEFGIVDAMFAPVAVRFKTYGLKTSGYADRILELTAIQEWYAGAMKEDFIAANHK